MPQAKHAHTTSTALPVTGLDWRRTYSVRVSDNTAAPRYHLGETVHVHPEMEVRSQDWVLVFQIPKIAGASPVSIIGKILFELVDGDQRTFVLQRPAYGCCEIDRQSVLTIHRIVGNSEGEQ